LSREKVLGRGFFRKRDGWLLNVYWRAGDKVPTVVIRRFRK